MRIGIIGPGALGCLFAAKLSLCVNEQHEILLIDHRNERAATFRKQGLLYESDKGKQHIPVTVSSSPESLGQVEVLMCCVKSHQLDSCLTFISPLLTPSTLLIFFQNGIAHLKYGEQALLPAKVAYATSSEGATLLATGHIRHAGHGHTVFGYLTPGAQETDNHLQQLQSFFAKSGFDSSLSQNILTQLWTKLFVNVGINGLTAIYKRKNGQLLTSCAARGKLKKLVQEAEAVARALGIIPETDPVQAALTVCKRTAGNISSMLQDVQNLRPTEIDAINGEVSRLGKENGIPTPVNDELIFQVKTLEEQYL